MLFVERLCLKLPEVDREPVHDGDLVQVLGPHQLGRDGLPGLVAGGRRQVAGEVHEHAPVDFLSCVTANIGNGIVRTGTVQGSAKRLRPGLVNAAGNARQKR